MQTVLVVDDDASVRELITVILQVEGFTVLAAESSEDALDIAIHEHVDVVTIDLNLPGMSGRDLSRRLREDSTTAGIRQLIISGDPALDDTGLHVDAVLSKPFDFNRFVAALQIQARQCPGSDDEERELDEILARRLITPVFQPIADLETGEIVAVEGLTRGPAGPLATPGALFGAAQRLGRLQELDSLCRLVVLQAALDAAPLTPPLVTVNVEPGSVHLPMSEELRALLAGPLPFRVVVEFTERALTRRTAAVMRHAEEIRQRGNVVALDDLGSHPSSVAMLPLAQPEIVKLDMSLLADEVDSARQEAASAAAAFAQRTGAILVAEGIETEAHRATAIALGAVWGQGHLFGRPEPLASLARRRIRRDTPPMPRRPRVDDDLGVTPYGMAVEAGARVRRGSRATLIAISRRLEMQGLEQAHLGAVLVALQDMVNLDGRTLDAYAAIAARAGIVGILGIGVPLEPVPWAYGADLPPSDPLTREWVIAVVGPYDAVALCARPVIDPTRSGPSYEYCLTRDLDTAHRIARLLTRRLTPRAAVPRTTALVLP